MMCHISGHSSGPHQITMGCREARQLLAAVRRLCGQPKIGPHGVVDQSSSAIISPVRPPEARNDHSTGRWRPAPPDVPTASRLRQYRTNRTMLRGPDCFATEVTPAPAVGVWRYFGRAAAGNFSRKVAAGGTFARGDTGSVGDTDSGERIEATCACRAQPIGSTWPRSEGVRVPKGSTWAVWPRPARL
jgi:hypothetical protein